MSYYYNQPKNYALIDLKNRIEALKEAYLKNSDQLFELRSRKVKELKLLMEENKEENRNYYNILLHEIAIYDGQMMQIRQNITDLNSLLGIENKED